jgi:hypothetical protein
MEREREREREKTPVFILDTVEYLIYKLAL